VDVLVGTIERVDVGVRLAERVAERVGELVGVLELDMDAEGVLDAVSPDVAVDVGVRESDTELVGDRDVDADEDADAPAGRGEFEGVGAAGALHPGVAQNCTFWYTAHSTGLPVGVPVHAATCCESTVG
jgi:hypothetical protein